MFDLRLQEPRAAGDSVLEALLEGCAGADGGGGVFAWTNRAGAMLLLDDPAFASFLATGTFLLIVGTDSITDENAVELLAARAAAVPALRVCAFVHEEAVMFHPKFAWFTAGDQLRLIVGSGNLTLGGTRGNWEAFAVVTLDGAAAGAIQGRIEGWIRRWSANLLLLEDPRVLERVRRNTGRERDFTRMRTLPPPPPVLSRPQLSVLVAEIPRANTRWSQANFDLETYEGFFGAKVGTRRRISLQCVADDGSLGEIESRPSVEVRSRNYRFELAAARGLGYPASGRPIGVFVRLDSGVFLYRLALPRHPAHRALDAYLDGVWSGPEGRMRRVRTTVDELRAAWPDSPLWDAPAES